jgi:hypothetical protein
LRQRVVAAVEKGEQCVGLDMSFRLFSRLSFFFLTPLCLFSRLFFLSYGVSLRRRDRREKTREKREKRRSGARRKKNRREKRQSGVSS